MNFLEKLPSQLSTLLNTLFTPTPKENPFDSLPPELVQAILSRLPLMNQGKTMQVCRQWRDINSQNEQLEPFSDLVEKLIQTPPQTITFHEQEINNKKLIPFELSGKFVSKTKIILNKDSKSDFLFKVCYRDTIPKTLISLSGSEHVPDNILLVVSNKQLTDAQRMLLNEVQELANMILATRFKKR